MKARADRRRRLPRRLRTATDINTRLQGARLSDHTLALGIADPGSTRKPHFVFVWHSKEQQKKSDRDKYSPRGGATATVMLMRGMGACVRRAVYAGWRSASRPRVYARARANRSSSSPFNEAVPSPLFAEFLLSLDTPADTPFL